MTQPVTGVQRYARELLTELGHQGTEAPRFILAIPAVNVNHPIEGIETFHDNSLFPSSLWQQIRLPFLMNKLKARLLWSPCNVGPVYARNHVVTIHDAAVFAGPQWFSLPFRTYYRFLFPRLGKRALRIITPSTFSKEELVRYGVAPGKKITVIPSGVSSIFMSGRTIRSNNPYILTVGSRDPRKNISRLTEAWRRIAHEIKGGRKLLITGGRARGFSSENLHNLPGDVSFTGYVKDDALQSIYAGADVVIFPSLHEGFGLPPLEAMACGCPVIVSNTAGMPEVCGEAALYIDPFSIKSIAEGITELLCNRRLRETLVLRGLERVKHFTWKKSAQEHIRLFEEILARY
jgi:glycosyltransferase involved in cell wall biosynthesis